MNDVTPINRTLDQELHAVFRGASLECPVCGEFLLHQAIGQIECPECETSLSAAAVSQEPGLQLSLQAG